MNKAEIVLLLTLAAAYDYRKTGEADVEAWHWALDDIALEDAKEAVVAHYRESTEWLKPAHVRQGVKALRAARGRATPHPSRQIPSRFEQQDMKHQIPMATGSAPVHEVLRAVVGHLANQSPNASAVSAMDQLRAITSGPDDPVRDGEIVD